MSKSKLPRWRVTFDVVEHYSEEVLVRARDNIKAEEKAAIARRVRRINPRYIRETVDCEEIV